MAETGGGNTPKTRKPDSGKKRKNPGRGQQPEYVNQQDGVSTTSEQRAARKALLGTTQDPLRGGAALAEIGGFYEGGLGRLQRYADAAGNQVYTTPEQQQALARFRQFSDQYADGGRSGDTADFLSRYKESLAGYSSPQMQAMREQAQRGIDQQMRTQLGALRTSQARGGVRGASAAAQQANLDRMRMGEQQNLEQDLFVRNADEMQRRLEGYGNTLRGVEGEEYGRKMQTAQQYQTSLTGQEDRNRQSERYDLETGAAEKSGAMNSMLTAADLAQQERRFRAQKDLWQQAIRRGRSGPAFS